MLLSLTVKNFALIRELNLQPNKGLNVITGETGAGKSILLGALGLVLGNRAETSALLNTDLKCVVEAIFEVKNLKLHTFFEEHELDYADQTIIRREIAPGGKSRAFVNDTPVSLQILKELGERIIEIHTQNTGLLIKSATEQLAIIDDFAGEQTVLTQYKIQWKNYAKLRQDFDSFIIETGTAQKEKDFLQFQFDELEQFTPLAGEDTALEQLVKTLGHAEEIKSACSQSEYLLADSDNSIVDQLTAVRAQLKNIANVHPKVAETLQRLESQVLELKDISSALKAIGLSVESDPKKLDAANERIAKLQMLLKKHNLQNAHELVDFKKSLEEKLWLTEEAGVKKEKLEKQLLEAKEACKKIALNLHESRIKAAELLCKKTIVVLTELEMPSSKLLAHFEFDADKLGPKGASFVKLMFSANAGQNPQPLEKVASGGEVSRLNFAFKSLMAGKKEMPTLIFDEADTGVSGEVAGKMGSLMQQLGKNHQVIAITHLPQVAAAGESHYFVYKGISEGLSSTQIKLLDEKERILQIAQMLSGRDPGDAAVANARELLGVSN